MTVSVASAYSAILIWKNSRNFTLSSPSSSSLSVGYLIQMSQQRDFSTSLNDTTSERKYPLEIKGGEGGGGGEREGGREGHEERRGRVLLLFDFFFFDKGRYTMMGLNPMTFYFFRIQPYNSALLGQFAEGSLNTTAGIFLHFLPSLFQYSCTLLLFPPPSSLILLFGI